MLAGWAYCAAVWFIGVLLAIPAFVDGGKIAENVNSIATSVMVLAFCGLLTIAEERILQSSKGVVAETIAKKDWSKVLKAVPAIFQTLSFHFVVPVVCTKLHHEKRRCKLAVILGERDTAGDDVVVELCGDIFTDHAVNRERHIAGCRHIAVVWCRDEQHRTGYTR